MTSCNNVLFSNVSYRRNIKDMLFVGKLSDEEQAIAIGRSMSEIFGDQFEIKRLKNISLDECLKLKDKGLFTKELIENKDISACGTNETQEERILVNEEDHIRIIVQKKGFCLEDCFSRANALDDMLLDKLEMVFDSNLGYLTANPYLLGTGMEIGVAMFLPALAFDGKLKKIIDDILKNEFVILNLDGEIWNKKTPFVFIKNKFTFGYKENEFANKLKKIAEKLIELERVEDINQFNVSSSMLIDTIYRAYGVGTNAYRISQEEAEQILGKILWGINLKALNLTKHFDIINVLPKIKENTLGKTSNIKETEKKRARMLAEILKSHIVKGEVDV